MSDDQSTRASLFLRLCSDDPVTTELTWREFHHRYAPLIRAACRRSGLPDDDAGDVVQEVMLGFFRASPEFRYDPAKGRFRGYLKASTIRVLARRRTRTAVLATDPADDEPPGFAAEWDRIWDAGVLRRAMEEVRQSSSADHYEAFELSAVRGVPTAEIAERLRMSEANVRQVRSRVARQVKAAVERIREAEG